MTGFIGGGNMAEALIKGMTSQGIKDIIVSEPREERRRELEGTYGITATRSNRDVAASCDIIILAVKPQNMGPVLEEIRELVTEEKTVVSIAAGITLAYLESRLKTKRLIRVMPNTPALVQEGMSAISVCGCSYGPELNIVKSIFQSVGKVLMLPEKMMNAVTALSGSGPGFVALFVEALTGAGERLGLSGADSSMLAVQTLLGTAKILDGGMSAVNLRKMVTSPGGTTEAGVGIFEKRELRGIVAEALETACRRADELGKR